MATRNLAQTAQDLSDFVDPTAPETSQNGQGDSLDLGNVLPPDKEEKALEDLLDTLSAPVDAKRIEDRENSLFLPTGKYVWKANPEVTPRLDENDRKSGDVSAKGRVYVGVIGTLVNVQTKKEAKFNFTYSPDERTFEGGQLDFSTQIHAKLTSYFMKKMARRHSSEKELMGFIADRSKYALYITLSRNNKNNIQEFQNI
jgi:hypothetical protein